MKDDKLNDIVVIFRQGDMCYGLNGSRVIEIMKANKVIEVPKQPQCLYGVYNYKGTIIPIISMKKLCQDAGENKGQVFIILELEHRIYGLVVEEVLDMRYDNGKEIQFKMTDFENSNLIVYKVLQFEKVVLVLDIPKIIMRIEQQTNEIAET